ncbi:uncharacterized protein Dwil_GK21889 [Drosophila willistoni]|uniref:GK21889 n=1 Tax=Drosophila willistoni TaxID=7260 RepID=B4MQJ9_DROWI|nr:ER membrane protein complex subunit 7 homolog [Drosophila willistoni]XP_046866094.1 ER membrane protein complex subunit 7 homolog [Drosophila willistoni]EDW74388.1 uncharacterized protein Dwil_GK21889 [Drosophila willistoni]
MWLKILLVVGLIGYAIGQDDLVDEVSGLYTIEGRVVTPENCCGPIAPNQGVVPALSSGGNKWQVDLSITINDGEYRGYVREDGQFIISGVPSGSYVLEIQHPDVFYEPVRVEITPKGKFRARKVNFVQPAQVIQVPYPLRMKPLMRFKYFQTREQWKITDFLFSPMVLMMVLPLLLMLVLPKMINDPETKKEIENMQFPKMTNDLPEISDMLTSFLTGKQPEPKESKKPVTANKQTNKKRN